MASTTTIFNNAILEMVKGTMNYPGGTNTAYKVRLLGTLPTSPAKSDTLWSDLTTKGAVEIDTAGTNYTSGGSLFSSITAAINTSNGIEVTFTDVTWSNSSMSVLGAVIYQVSTGKLVAYIDFGQTISSSLSNWTLSASTPLRIQN